MNIVLRRLDRITAERPDAPALTEQGVTISFRQLDMAADILARRLFERRRSTNDIVGHFGTVGQDRIIAVVAALKAGMAYVMLDPTFPTKALNDIAQNAELDHLVAKPELAVEAERHLGMAPLPIEAPAADAPTAPPFARPPYDPKALVCIRYTSGSTGRPKGVPADGLHVEGRVSGRRKSGQVGPGQRTSLFNQFWLEEELYAISSGAELECFDFRAHGPQALSAWLQDRRPDRFVTYAAMYRALAATEAVLYSGVKVVDLIGEALTRRDFEAFNERFEDGAVLVNRFGSTEMGTLAEFIYRRGDRIDFETAPLGRIVANGDVFVLNEQDEPVADGEPGEFVIAADYVPDGYHRDPERSAQVFEPAIDGSGRIQLRSGFMVYRGHDGQYHPIGRKDEEVKIRGYNVRPTEVEQMLLDHPGVDEAVVAPFDGPQGVCRLACHFIPATQPAPTAVELSRFLGRRAPNYMVPGVFLAHGDLPRTENGKIRRNDLPDPLALISANADARARPETESERIVVHAWRAVLGHAAFTLDDDFFDIGGDSLQAMTALLEIERRSGVRAPFESLILDGATVRRLAARIDGFKADHADKSPAAILRSGDGARPLVVLHTGGGHLSDYLEVIDGLPNRQTVFGVRARGMDGRVRPDATIDAMADHAADVIRRSTDATVSLVGYSYAAPLALETARRLIKSGDDVELILLDPIAPWAEPWSETRKTLRRLRDGALISAARSAATRLADAVGAEIAPSDIDAAHALALQRYRPAGPVAPSRTLIVWADDQARSAAVPASWRSLTAGPVDEIEHPGGHFLMPRGANARPLAQKLEAWRAQSVPPPIERGPTH